MSSIKRDVKKKVLPRPEGEKILSRDTSSSHHDWRKIAYPLYLGSESLWLANVTFGRKIADLHAFVITPAGASRSSGTYYRGDFSARLPQYQR